MGALRLFLAFGVLTVHFDPAMRFWGFLDYDQRWTLRLTGGHCVILFYIVSGFLISFVLATKYPVSLAGTYSFYRSRVLRIFPLWWATMAFSAIYGLWVTPISIATLSAILLFGSDWIAAFTRDVNFFPFASGIGWTLGAELTFYALAPWILRSTVLMLICFSVSLLIRAVLINVFSQDNGATVAWTYFFFPSTLCFFILGHIARLLGSNVPPLISVACLSVSLFLFYYFPSTLVTSVFHVSATLFAIALPGLFSITKDSRLINFLGDLTYPVYLIGALVSWLMFSYYDTFGRTIVAFVKAAELAPYWQSALFMGMYCTAALLAAIFVHLTIEPLATMIVRRVIDFCASAFGRARGERPARPPA